MNCDEVRKLMDGYLDGELDPVTSQKVDQHLRDCVSVSKHMKSTRC